MAYAARSLAVSAPATWPGAVSILVAAMILVAVGGRLAGQTPPPSTFIDWSADDSARVAFLAAHGRAVRGPGVIFWTPDDSLDRGWVTAFADSLGRAVGRLRSSIGTHLWQRLGDRPVVFYVSPDRFVSHASGRGAVFLVLRSVRERYAPFLHEASHVLLAAAFPFYPVEAGDSLREERAGDRFHFWLSEGLADYLAQRAAGDTGFREGDVFAVGGLAEERQYLRGEARRPPATGRDPGPAGSAGLARRALHGRAGRGGANVLRLQPGADAVPGEPDRTRAGDLRLLPDTVRPRPGRHDPRRAQAARGITAGLACERGNSGGALSPGVVASSGRSSPTETGMRFSPASARGRPAGCRTTAWELP
jgi:hypothetical protein